LEEIEMRILVIDDNVNNLLAAKQTLAAHEVTACQSYDEALHLLRAEYVNDEGERFSYPEKDAKQLPYWDAVLCDLMMPAGKDAQGPKGMKYIGQEMPVGWSLAMVAAKRGAKYAAVASDANHHDHPASAMLDRLYGIIKIEGAQVMLTNEVQLVGLEGSGSECSECHGAGKYVRDDGQVCNCWDCSGTGMIFSKKGKNWGAILDTIISSEK
jgi:CheY-like chemotaxis protein